MIMIKTHLKSRTLVLLLAILALFASPQTATATADSNSGDAPPMSPRVFTRGSFVYVVEPMRVVFLSMDTRSSHTLYTAPDSIFSIVSVVQGGDMIWAANAAGAVMGINMQTGTVEEYGRSRVAPGGRIDADRRYLWLAAEDTLFRMDMVSREWVPIPIPGCGGEAVRGLVSFNDQVHVITASAVRVYRPLSDDWTAVPHPRFVLGGGDLHKAGNICYFTYGKWFYSYDPSKRLWSRSSIGSDIRSVSLTPEFLAIAADNRVYYYNASSHILEPQPVIPMLRGIRSLARYDDGRVVCAVDRGIAFSASPFDFDLAVYPDYIKLRGGVFVFSYHGYVMLYTGSGFVFYHPGRRIWSSVPVVVRNRTPDGRYAWDENGAGGSLTDNISYTLNGDFTLRRHSAFARTPEEGFTLEPGEFLPNAALTAHAEDLDGRFLDLTLDNAVTTLPPQKGFYYKGADGDILSRASFGVQGTGMSPGGLIPDVTTEGVSAVFSGKSKAGDRDRSVMSASAGSGFILSRTEWRTLNYEGAGVYHLQAGDGKEIDAKSVKVYVDGAALSGSDFVYDPARRTVRILRRDRADPASVIQVSFSAKALPDLPTTLEPLPENHYGQYNFVEGGVSPRSWLGLRGGLLTLDSDEPGPMVFAGAPVEWRSANGNRAVLLTPDVIYDAKTGAHSAGVTLGARESRAFGSYRGFWAGRDFTSMDRRSFADANIGEEHELDFGYDVTDNFRVGWYQQHRSMDGINMSNFELRSNYTGDQLPDIEMSVSSHITEYGFSDGDRRRKETAGLRFSDLSSSYLSRMSRMHNVGYDFSLTEYRTGADERGRMVYGMASVSPIDRLTFTGTGMYRDNPSDCYWQKEASPTLTVNARDFPRGIDASGTYTVYVASKTDGGIMTGTGRSVNGYVYPGEYAEVFDRFILYLEYFNYLESNAADKMSVLKLSFIADENTYYRETGEIAVLAFMPTENMLLSTYKARFKMKRGDDDGSIVYRSAERARLWFEGGSALEGNLGVVKSPGLLSLEASSFYEHRWSGRFMTGAGAFGVRHEENGAVTLYAGPRFIISQTMDFSGFVRNLEHSHLLWATFDREEMSKPGIDYAFNLRLKMRPNIALVAELNINSRRLSEAGGGGGLYLHAGF